MKIGNKLEKLRRLKNLTQENVACELGLSTQAYGKIERNEVDVNQDKLEKLTKIFNITMEELMQFDEKVYFNNSANNSMHAVVINSTISTHIELLKTLQEQLSQKDKQLAEKDKQITELISLLNKLK